MRAAIIIDGVVRNVITLATIADYQGPGIAVALAEEQPVNPGDLYHDGGFLTAAGASKPQTITPSEFLAFFTDQELNAAATHPALAGWWRVYEGLREGVERDSPRTLRALDILVALEIITPQRVAEILQQWPNA
jgi:hypothetical protein